MVSNGQTPHSVWIHAGATVLVATGGTLTISGNVGLTQIDGTLTLNGTGLLNGGANSQALDLRSGGRIDVDGSNGFPTAFEALVIDAVSTVQYGLAGIQIIENTSFATYGNLILAGSGLKTIENSGSLDAAGDVTIGVGTTLDGNTNNEDVNVAGDWTNDGTYDSSGQTATFNGTTAQTISGATTGTFNNVVLDNEAGNHPIGRGPGHWHGWNVDFQRHSRDDGHQ